MEDRKQRYRVINITEERTIAENFTSADVSALLGMQIQEVSRCAREGRIHKKRFVIVKQNELPDKHKRTDLLRSKFWLDWRKTTESIREKVLWCSEPDEGVKKIYLGRSKTKYVDTNRI